MLLPTHARGMMASLRPEWYRLSPAVGLAFSAGGAHLLSRLYELEPRIPIAEGAQVVSAGRAERWRGSPIGRLARDLLHRNHAEEPLYPTTNRSLPAAHLSASLCAHVGALASERISVGSVHGALSRAICSDTGLTLPKLAKATGVSIARFERLVELVRLADEESSGMCERVAAGTADGGASDNPPRFAFPGAGTSMLLRLLWLRSSVAGKGALRIYLETLENSYGPVLLDGQLLEKQVDAEFTLGDLSAPAVTRSLNVLFPQGANSAVGGEAEASAFEVLAAAMGESIVKDAVSLA